VPEPLLMSLENNVYLEDEALIIIDRIAEVVDRAEQPALAETNQIIRTLPVRYQFDITDVNAASNVFAQPTNVVAYPT